MCNTTTTSPLNFSGDMNKAIAAMKAFPSREIVDVFVTTQELASKLFERFPKESLSTPTSLEYGIPLEVYPTLQQAVSRATELKDMKKHVRLVIWGDSSYAGKQDV